ncbi:M15 family metallopeptidase [Alteromonadaceae bacterium BrNp21-10]|nr:M15 family metallopeptidase [Alteromonadaceae bacterium BrNp21-10]
MSRILSLSSEQYLGLDGSLLIDCQQSHKLLPLVADAFDAMCQAAQQHNIDISIASSYRDFQRQLLIWNEKWNGQRPLLDINSQVVDATTLTDEQKLTTILTWSALPGSSRHHWGTDFDVYDAKGVQQSGQALQLVTAEYTEGGPCFELAKWLTLQAATFGFYRPYLNFNGGVASEPWHISFEEQATHIISQFDLDALANLLRATDIAGKDIILNSLDEIFTRYVLNGQPR